MNDTYYQCFVPPLFSLGIIGARNMGDYVCSQQANMLAFGWPATVVCQLVLRVAYVIELTRSRPPFEHVGELRFIHDVILHGHRCRILRLVASRDNCGWLKKARTVPPPPASTRMRVGATRRCSFVYRPELALVKFA